MQRNTKAKTNPVPPRKKNSNMSYRNCTNIERIQETAYPQSTINVPDLSFLSELNMQSTNNMGRFSFHKV